MRSGAWHRKVDMARWTKEEDKILIEKYADLFAGELAQLLPGKNVGSIYRRASLLGLKSSREKLARSGRMSAQTEGVKSTQFKKGHKTWNKGRPMSPEVYAKAKATMFKCGQQPLNYRPVGSERISVDGYVEIKVADPGIWKLKHRVLWEDANGPIPKGMMIKFKNGNKLDIRLDNLIMITQAENMRDYNSYITKYPKEIQTLIQLKGAVNRQIRKKEKQYEEGSKS